MDRPKIKRQKVNVACDPCRTRKVKCDGCTPVCGPCKARASSGLNCTWQAGIARLPNSSSLPVQQLNVRPRPEANDPHAIRQVSSHKQRNIKHSQLGIQPNDSVLQATRITNSCERSSSNQNHGEGLIGHGIEASKQAPLAQQVSDEISLSNLSVHGIFGAVADEETIEGFFGTSSAATFMQTVKKTVQQKVGGMTLSEQPRSTLLNPSMRPPGSGLRGAKQRSMEYVLPSRRRADALLTAYWQYVHVLYPYLDKKQIEDDFESLWKADGSIVDERSFMCLLNIIFALASQIDISTPIPERGRLANDFFTRATELLDVIDTGSVRSVESFLMLGQYFQSTSEPHPCWVYIGLAIRTAQSLGLHLAETTERINDVRVQQRLRKLWHGCILMDRVVSMTYGRPCMIGPKAAVAVPLPLVLNEEQDISHDVPQASTSRSTDDEFFVLSLRLYDILHDVIYAFYSVNSTKSQTSDSEKHIASLGQGYSSVFEIECKLVTWEHSIPDHLKYLARPHVEPVRITSCRQSCILHQRQLQVRILLLRPMLSKFIASEYRDFDATRYVPLGDLLSYQIVLQSAVVCVRMAVEAIETIHTGKGSGPGDLGYVAAWWYNTLYLYSSATVLIAARLSSVILVEIGEDCILGAWAKAMEILEGYSGFSDSIKRLTATLSVLSEAIPRHYSHFKTLFHHNNGARSDDASNPNYGIASMASPYWRPLDTIDLSTQLGDLLNSTNTESVGGIPNDFHFDFFTDFDPNDTSWLMTFPQSG